MLTIALKVLGFWTVGVVFAVAAAYIRTRPTERTPKNDYDTSDVEIIECPDCGISTFAGTERCPLCGRNL